MLRTYSGVWQSQNGADGGEPTQQRMRASRPVSLRSLLKQYAMPCIIDMVDIDIQGSEYQLFSRPSDLALLNRHVRRVHIGLHSQYVWGNEVDASLADHRLLDLFEKHGWRREWVFRANLRTSSRTGYGPVVFGDGVLSFVNRRQHLGGRGCRGHFGNVISALTHNRSVQDAHKRTLGEPPKPW
eukprot:TRINITY_DN7001_c0_g1_i4.p1 TRINITY_DN7001_c0_g1~~TRINITY_DN7001_c0_g1_i4.p1  ORF type:complete len:184 (+),score=20.36 TRINITY_DN7001_c0_g1_i4:279-830(+)